ncbi:MAG: tetratricopeptide repeat protein [Aquificaceae bacterium]
MKGGLLILFSLFLFSCSAPTIVILKDPLTSQEHVDLGYIYEKQGKLDLAEKEYKKAIKKDGKNWIAYYNLGNIYAKREEWRKAENFYKKAIEIKRDPDALNNLAYVLNKQGKYCLAQRIIKEAIEKENKEDYRETEKEIERAIKEKKVNCSSFEGEGEPW